MLLLLLLVFTFPLLAPSLPAAMHGRAMHGRARVRGAPLSPRPVPADVTAPGPESNAHDKIYTASYLTIYHGRLEARDPSPRCCFTGDSCLEKHPNNRFAFVTSIRSDGYLPLLQELQCSLQRTNPKVPLLVLTVKGDLSNNVLEKVVKMVGKQKVLTIEDIRYKNAYRDRFALNWIKLRLWSMTDYDGLIWLDTDMTVLENLEHVFKLPTAYAATPDMNKPHTQGHPLGRTQGGLFFLRPCPAVMDHMLKLLETHSRLQFKDTSAEQSFLDWYFKFDRFMLPVEYNAISTRLPNVGSTSWGGAPIKVVHHTGDKPFKGKDPKIPAHRFLCLPPEQLLTAEDEEKEGNEEEKEGQKEKEEGKKEEEKEAVEA